MLCRNRSEAFNAPQDFNWISQDPRETDKKVVRYAMYEKQLP